MAKKRESRQKSRQSDAIRGEKKPANGDRDTDRDIVTVLTREWTNDREKLRRVRELCEQAAPDRWYIHKRDILAILNGTERKGGKR
jgi:hypothetical protein